MSFPRGILGYNHQNVNYKNVDAYRSFRSFNTNSVDTFKGTGSSPLAFSTMVQSERVVYDRHRNRRRRYMIGDALLSMRGSDSYCRKVCCLPTVLYKSSSAATASPIFNKDKKKPVTNMELYCSAINPDDTATDDSQIENSEVPSKAASWKETLLRFSTIASILCVIDCTILPILTIVLPLLGMVSAVNTILPFNHLVHHYGHLMTIYFVLPIGFFATTINFLYNHRKKWITAIGWCGLLLILAANTGSGGCGPAMEHVHAHSQHTHHTVVVRTVVTHASLSLWDGMIQSVSSILHTIQHGIYHRITNLSGCALLIVSNYISHQYQKNHHATHAHGKDCCTPSPRPANSLQP